MKNEIRAKIEGRVQGVGYRYFIEKLARSQGLSGYARNLEDGGVEVVAQGDDEALARLAAMLEIGPSGAQVDNVDIEWRQSERKRLGFETY